MKQRGLGISFRRSLLLALGLATVTSWAPVAEAQRSPGIRGVTRRSVTSPGIGVEALVPLTNAAPATPGFASPVVPVSIRITRKEDPAELDKRVLAFQKKCADDGSAWAQLELGRRYLEGKGVPQDLELARSWLQRASDGGNSEAKRLLKTFSAPESQEQQQRQQPPRR